MNTITALLLAIQKGNKALLKNLYDSTRYAVFASIMPYLYDQQLAEDVMHLHQTYPIPVISNILPSHRRTSW
jgi:hypothetical protein